MKFSVSRVSDFFGKECPCENAAKGIDPVYDVPLWTIEINSLSELIGFVDKYGTIILEHTPKEQCYPHIDIYDDYIE